MLKKIYFSFFGAILSILGSVNIVKAACTGNEKKVTSPNGLGFTCVPDFAKFNTQVLGVSGLNAVTDEKNLIGKLTTIIKWLQYGLFLVAAFLIILAAYDYLTSRGESEGIKKAQNTLLYAVVAIVVGLLAGGIPSIVKNILGF